MKRIPLILSPALLLLLPAIALYPTLHASAEKDGVDSSTAIQAAAPSEAAPSEAAPSEAAPSEAAPSETAPVGSRPRRKPPRRRPPRRTAPSLPPPLPPPSAVLSKPVISPSPTASNRRFTAIWPPTIPRWGT